MVVHHLIRGPVSDFDPTPINFIFDKEVPNAQVVCNIPWGWISINIYVDRNLVILIHHCSFSCETLHLKNTTNRTWNWIQCLRLNPMLHNLLIKYTYLLMIFSRIMVSYSGSSPRWENLPSGYHNYPLKGLNLRCMYCSQKHSSE